MTIDQSKLGKHIQEQMQAIEQDPDVPEGAEINSIITLVEIIDQASGTRNMRIRSNVPPHVAIGVLEESKMSQLAMLSGQPE